MMGAAVPLCRCCGQASGRLSRASRCRFDCIPVLQPSKVIRVTVPLKARRYISGVRSTTSKIGRTLMKIRYSFLRSASKIILVLGIVTMAISLLVGVIALANRPATDDGLMTAAFIISGIMSGLFIAAGGQLLQVVVDISDSLQRIETNSECFRTLTEMPKSLSELSHSLI
jgi:hypothetical protein